MDDNDNVITSCWDATHDSFVGEEKAYNRVAQYNQVKQSDRYVPMRVSGDI